jgi:hypothetical protein
MSGEAKNSTRCVRADAILQLRVRVEGTSHWLQPELSEDDGSKISAKGALEIDAALRERCELRQIEQREARDLGQELWARLEGAAPEIARRLYGLRHAELRLVLRVVGLPGPSVELAALPWEALGYTERDYDWRPILSGHWELVRTHGELERASEPGGTSFRVLGIWGSQAQKPGLPPAEDAAFRLMKSLRELAQNQGLQFEIAAPVEHLGRGGEELEVDVVFATRKGLLEHLERERYHLVHFVGHSDATPDRKAERLCLELPGRANDEVPITDFARALGQQRRTPLVVLHACMGSATLAAELLRTGADHVLAMNAFVHPEFCAEFAASLYGALGREPRLGPALRHARGTLAERHRHSDAAWMPTHHARSLDDALFDPQGFAIARYCEKLARETRRISLRFGRKRELELEQVHVALALATGTDAKGEERFARETLRFAALLQREERSFALRGSPGAGKSTTLRFHALRCALDLKRTEVAIYQRLPKLPPFAAERESALTEQFLAQIAGTYELKGIGLESALDALGQDGKLVFLLDGWDEVKPERREEAQRLVQRLRERWPKSRLVVAARGSSKDLPQDLVSAVIQPLSEPDQLELLRKHFRSSGQEDDAALAHARSVLQKLQVSEARVDELRTNPLLLTLLAEFDASGIEVAGLARPMLYEQMLDLLLKGEYAEQTKRAEWLTLYRKDLRSLLRAIAWHLTEQLELELADWRTLPKEIQQQIETLRAKIASKVECADELEFLQLLAEQTGIFVPDGEDHEASWSFPHRSFLEALSAEHWLEVILAKERDLPQRIEQELRQRLAAAEQEKVLDFWAEPLALVAARVPNGDRLIAASLRADVDLGLRVLACRERVEASCVPDIFAACPAWRFDLERYTNDKPLPLAAIYELLPARGEPRALVSILEKRAASESDLSRAELGALVECLVGLGARRAVEAILVSLPKLSSKQVREHFAYVPNPKHSTEAYWCRAPRDRYESLAFVIGSPVGEDGRDDDEEQKPVEFQQAFWIGAVPVTEAAYRLFDPSRSASRRPAVDLSWYEATLFARWLEYHRRRDPKAWSFLPAEIPSEFVVRLPTEREWEFSCRAGTTTRFWSGDEVEDLKRVGWIADNSERRIHEVAEKPANAWGLYDVHGNVLEWCRDAYEPRYGSDLWGPSAAPRLRVLRGGSGWFEARFARSARRDWYVPGYAIDDIGFRLALSAPPPEP